MTMYDNVKDICKKRDVKIESVLEKALGKGSKDLYYGWKRRNSLPRVDAAIAIAQTLDVSVYSLLGVEEPAPIPERLKEVVKLLDEFNDSELTSIQIMLNTMLAARKK